jgi:Predicted membrane protein
MKNTFTKIRDNLTKNDYRFLIAAFFIPLCLMWLIYIAMEVWPFGESSVLVLDLNGQYVYFFEELRRKLLTGGSLLYSWSRALGGEFMGIYAYYLASPFSLLVLLFPKTMITEALLAMILLKIGSAGLTMAYYLYRTRPSSSKIGIVLFSTMYALTAYSVVMAHNTMWIDNMILLPVITLGIERLISRGRYKLFIISLAMALLSNFYIGYMMCIYVFAYFFYWYIAHGDSWENNFYREKNHFIKSLGRVALAAVIVIMIAAVIILPTWYSLNFGKTTFSTPKYEFTQKFDFLDFATKFFYGSYDTVRPEGLPFVYCGTLALIFMPLYFVAKNIKAREKALGGLFLAFFVFSFNCSVVDMIWHGFQKPNWLNYRYSFMFCFFVLVLAYKAFCERDRISMKSMVAVCGALGIILMLIQKQNYDYVNDLTMIWVSLGLLGLYIILIYLESRGSLKGAGLVVLGCAVCVEAFTAGLQNTVALDADVVISSRTGYRTFMDKVQPIVDAIQANDDSLYRMEKNFHRKTNDAMALGFFGLSNSSSTLNASVIKLLNELGYASLSHWSKYLGGTPVSDSLMGIKYLILDEATNQYLYQMTAFDEENNYRTYYNPYALSIAYAVSDKLSTIDAESYDSPMEFMNALVTLMLGEDETVEIFKPVEVVDTETTNCDMSYTTGQKRYAPTVDGSDAKLTFTLNAANKYEIFCYFPTDTKREVSMTVNGTDWGTVYGSDTDRIISLGTMPEGENFDVTLKLKTDAFYIKTNANCFWYLDIDTFKDAFTRLAQGNVNFTEYSDTYLEGTVNMPADRTMLFTSIPFDEGWHVTADGVKLELVKAAGSLLAVKIPAGEHTLTFTYMPDCVVQGRIISSVGLVSFAALTVGESIIRRRRDRRWAAMASLETPII